MHLPFDYPKENIPEAWEQLKEDVRAYMQAHPDIINEMPSRKEAYHVRYAYADHPAEAAHRIGGR